MKRKAKPKVLTLQSSGAVARLAAAMAFARLDLDARLSISREAERVIESLLCAARGPR